LSCLPPRDRLRRRARELVEILGAESKRLSHETEGVAAHMTGARDVGRDLELKPLERITADVHLSARRALLRGHGASDNPVADRDVMLGRRLLEPRVAALDALHDPSISRP